MMVGCLILYHVTISGLTKCKVLRAMFHEKEYEIHVSGKNTVVLYLWNVKKIEVWQAAVDFESTNITACYGFGRIMEDAHMNAEKLLRLRNQNGTIIKEEQVVYEVS